MLPVEIKNYSCDSLIVIMHGIGPYFMVLCVISWHNYGFVCYYYGYMVLTYIDTVEMILSDWHDTDAGGSRMCHYRI